MAAASKFHKITAAPPQKSQATLAKDLSIDVPKFTKKKGKNIATQEDVGLETSKELLVENNILHGTFESNLVNVVNGNHRIQEQVVNESCDISNTDDGCREYHSSEALDILEHVFDELGEILTEVVSPLREPLDLDFLQDNLDMRPKPRKFRQSMFAGRPLIDSASSSKVRVNMSRTTGPSTIVSPGLPQVHRARGQHLERKNSNE
ncbi:hypothetical protein ACH5RR_034243 [Cinchona calisaya]|uniref:Uncharacterized protein n=1 Tax=Cinchona calisaya TaxID=153742 RepID=A0ABD2YAB4_9GENT